MLPLISLIAPVYKVEPYLREALDSACAQTYTNLEIILVDDGSPDSCGAICDEYAARDPRIKVIHKENGGVGNARNAGLDVAHGDYVTFFDPDDVMDCDMIDYLYHLRTGEENEVVCCSFYTQKRPENEEIKIIRSSDVIGTIIQNYLYGPFAKLYPRKFVGDLRFPQFYRAEDAVYNILVAERTKHIVYSTARKYYYRVLPTGAMKRAFSIRDLDTIQAHEIVFDSIRNRKDLTVIYIRTYVASIENILKKADDGHEKIWKHASFVQYCRNPSFYNQICACKDDFSFEIRYVLYVLRHFPLCLIYPALRFNKGYKKAVGTLYMCLKRMKKNKS